MLFYVGHFSYVRPFVLFCDKVQTFKLLCCQDDDGNEQAPAAKQRANVVAVEKAGVHFGLD